MGGIFVINVIWINWNYWKAIGKMIFDIKLTDLEKFILEIK